MGCIKQIPVCRDKESLTTSALLAVRLSLRFDLLSVAEGHPDVILGVVYQAGEGIQ